MAKVVTAMDARKHFGEILNNALYREEETLIKRKGRIVAKLVPVVGNAHKTREIGSYAGLWKNADDVRRMKEGALHLRKSSLRKITRL